MNTVWVVDKYIDITREKKVREVEKRDLWLSRFKSIPDPRFATREEAYQFLIDRAAIELVKAEQKVVKAKARLKKCRAKLAPKPEPMEGE